MILQTTALNATQVPFPPEHEKKSLTRAGARAAVLALAALAVLALAVPAQAQTTYVSNIGQSEDASSLAFLSFDQGQGFTTGTDTAGYVLGSVDIRLDISRGSASTGSQIPTVTIVQGTPTGTVVATLSKPASLAGTGTADYTFKAPVNTTLSASTTYYVVIESSISGISTARTNVDDEDSGGESGWSINNVSNWRNSGSSGSFSTAASALMIKVKGPSPNTAPTGADKTVTTVQNTNYTFSRTDFGFVDADDDQLASVLIVTVPTAGRLVLNGDTVMASQTVTRTEIVVGSGLKFEPADGASGAGYASFTFKVNDGTDDSVSAYTMTINVTIITAPDAPTGLTATASGQAWIELAWTAPVRAGGRAVTGYRIEVSLDDSSWSDLVLVAATRSTATTYVHKGLNAGATRYYRVSAINVAGASEPSGSDHATTRTDEQLVSNFNHRGDAGNDNVHLVRQNVVGIFTTGSRDARLNSIELRLGHLNRSFVPTTLKLYEAEKGTGFQRVKHGEKEVATLTIPSRRLSLPANSFQTFSYELPSGTSPPSLAASTKYIFVLEPSTVGVILVETTTYLSEDAVKADGWTIDGSGLGTTSPYSIPPTRSIVVRVNGTDIPNTAPTADDNTVTMPEDGRYEFSATDFGFHDTNLADRLVSVQIVTVPALGALALDGTDVTLNQVVTKTQIDAGDLIFTPVTGGSGNNYTSFNFKVNDGTVFSADAYTMRIDVTPTPALTGQVFVDNTAETDYLEAVANGQSSQSFTTGPNSGGYILSSIGVVASSVDVGDNFSVAVHNADADGAPLALRTSLLPPGNFRKGEKHTIHFHAPPNTNLMPNTTYSIVLGPGRTLSHRRVIATQSNADIPNGATDYGWSIGDALHTYRNRAWSSPNDGRSVKIVIRGRAARGVANNAPVFSLATVDRSIAENTAAGRNVGAVVTATDADNDPLGYTLGGADMASFGFDETTGQIRTRAGVSYDHEARSSYTVTVTASDGTDSAVADVTISVTDVAEPPRAPATPVVSAVAGSNTSLRVTWAAPANAGRPRHRQLRPAVPRKRRHGLDRRPGSFHDHDRYRPRPRTRSMRRGLPASSRTRSMRRGFALPTPKATPAGPTPPGAGRTNTLTNNAPVFSPAIVGRSIAENIAAGRGSSATAVTATDADAGDTLGYTLGGADAASFDFVETTGQIRTKADVSYDFEARSLLHGHGHGLGRNR